MESTRWSVVMRRAAQVGDSSCVTVGGDECGDCACAGPRLLYGEEKVANREIRVWHGAAENGPSMIDESKTPPSHLGSCRYLTLYRGVLDLSIIQ
jgi:hypothetical protein